MNKYLIVMLFLIQYIP